MNADFRGRKIGDIFGGGFSILPVFFWVSPGAVSLVFALISNFPALLFPRAPIPTHGGPPRASLREIEPFSGSTTWSGLANSL
jgi:hypothetical protein